MPPKIEDGIFEDLGEMFNEAPPKAKTPSNKDKPETWSPSLSETQQKIFDSTAQFILASGGRYSGKTYVLGGHKLIRHCYENFNADALIIVGVRSQATQGGVWEKLFTAILPEWKDGLGLEYTEEKMNEQRIRYFYICNRHGGWSRVSLMSIPHGANLQARIRGIEPSYVFVDELTGMDVPAYFDDITQQVGRRQGIEIQQYTAATNPDGPSHWVYNRFYENPWQELKDIDGKVISKEGEWDSRYAVFELNFNENRKNAPESYYQNVVSAVRNNPIEYQRLVEGKWVDMPSGDALFANSFQPAVHIKGKGHKRILPIPGHPIFVGYDLGQANNAITFCQAIPTSRGISWLVFDEIVHVHKKIAYPVIVSTLMRKMRFWNDRMGEEFRYNHISDDSAFNQFRAASGSYDVLDIQRISTDVCEKYELPPIRMKPAPKFAGARIARVRLLSDVLESGEFYVSHTCKAHIEMLKNLQSEKAKKGTYDPEASFKPKRSVHLHPFDSLTYVIISVDASSHYFNYSAEVAKSELIAMGVDVS